MGKTELTDMHLENGALIEGGQNQRETPWPCPRHDKGLCQIGLYHNG